MTSTSPEGKPPRANVIVLGPAFVLGDAEIEKIGTALERALDTALAAL